MRQYLSTPLTQIKNHYDIVVVGSGYGGSIAASRLSRAKRSVCLLERGRELQPGDYPDTFWEGQDEIQINTETKTMGHENGLFDFHAHDDISVLVGCGLGGTSLINANVSILPENWVFQSNAWPASISSEFSDPSSLLHKGYELARQMLKPNPLPDSIKLNKLNSLEKSAKAAGGVFSRTDININFERAGPNHVGVYQSPCNSCGNCCSGCNYGAKNTVLMNYLPDAVAFGAEIFTEAGVEYIEKFDDIDGKQKWRVHFKNRDPAASKERCNIVTADILILAAGTLGSTEIMLRSRDKGLKTSDHLGRSFSGNGDMLAFGYNTEVQVDAVGALERNELPVPAPGPCITGSIDIRKKPDRENGIVIQDAVIPGILARLLPASLFVARRTIGSRELALRDYSFSSMLRRLKRQKKSLRKDGAYKGAVQNTQTYLVMGHDGSNGKLLLNSSNRLTIDWNDIGDHNIFRIATKTIRRAIRALSGIFIRNPYFVKMDEEFLSAECILRSEKRSDPHWLKKFQNSPITVHPLGGCRMADDYLRGVVNDRGQVYNSETSVSVYENLYIADGSIVPRSLGVNPLLTISALAERICALIAKDHAWEINYAFGVRPIPVRTQATQSIGITFTEVMSGSFNSGDKEHNLSCTLTVGSNDVDELIKSTEHEAKISGFIKSSFFGPNDVALSDGTLHLLIDSPDDLNLKLMKYFLKIPYAAEMYMIYGEKRVKPDQISKELEQTSILYITVYKIGNQPETEIGKGIMRISVIEIANMLRSVKAVNARTDKEALLAVTKFGKFFSRSLFEVYGGIFAPLDYFDSKAPARRTRPLRAGTLIPYDVFPADDKKLKIRLTRYQGGGKGPLLMTHGFSGNRLTFSIDTIDTNAVEYFYSKGYDVWLLDFRTSTLLESASQQHSVDDIASYDYPAAVEKIREVTGKSEIDVLAHCLGSMALLMALMKGMQGVRSAVCAQNAMYFVPAKEVRWKAGLHVPSVLRFLGINSLTAYAEKHENWKAKIYDRMLAFYAEDVAGYCSSPSCHRLTFMFGSLSEHSNLNSATHTALVEMFGKANMSTFEHLTKMIRKGKLIDKDGEDIYLPNISNLKLPITFIHGEKNALFLPEGTKRAYETLCKSFGSQLYRFELIRGYGHNDCMYGKNAVKDVFQYALQQFEAVQDSAATA